MAINEHITEFAGWPVVDVNLADPSTAPTVPSGEVAWRLASDYNASVDDIADQVEQFLKVVDPASIQALIWNDSWGTRDPIEPLLAVAPRFTALRALFVSEFTDEECHISWIKQGDLMPLLAAYPDLEVLRVRSGEQYSADYLAELRRRSAGNLRPFRPEHLELQPVRHTALRQLVIESGGLSGEVVGAVGECDLPALEHLELWLGTHHYGGSTTVEDLAPILTGAKLPALGYLGLRNAEIADEVAVALASAPIVARLHTLDLSLGLLSDEGAAALVAGQPLTHLRRLDLHHHAITAELEARLAAELPRVDLDMSVGFSLGDDDEWMRGYYVAVSE